LPAPEQKLKKSVLASNGSPRTCFGDMYPAVPSTTPVPVLLPKGDTVSSIKLWGVDACAASTSLAMPKSSNFTYPSRVMKTFSGFKSRWTMLRSCVAASPLGHLGRPFKGPGERNGACRAAYASSRPRATR
jgi:hypothetical protein